MTLADVKAILGIVGTTYDAALTAAMPLITQRFEQYTRRGLARRVITDEMHRHERVSTRVYLWAFPVAVLTAITLDGVDADIQSFDLDAQTGIIESRALLHADRVVVDYTGGYAQDAVPIDLQHAYATAVGVQAAVPDVSGASGTSAIRSIGLGGGALQVAFDTARSTLAGSYDVTGVPPDLMDYAGTLNYYRRMVL